MIAVGIIVGSIAVIILFAFFLKKFSFDFKGKELVVFWVIFTLGVYLGIEYAFFWMSVATMFLAVYYLLRLCKTRKYIRWYLFVIQIILSAVFLIIFIQYEKTICQGWCNGSLIIYAFLLAVVAYMLLMNLIKYVVSQICSIVKKLRSK